MTEITKGKSPRQTKIIVTLGPATDTPEVIEALIKAGVDAVRINFSHGRTEDHLRRAQLVRKLSLEAHYHIGLIADLQGPKIRVGKFIKGEVQLKEGQEFVLSGNIKEEQGTEQGVGLTYPDLYKDVYAGDILLLDDGRVELKVVSSSAGDIVAIAQHDATLSSNKGVNRQGGGLSAPSITDKDREDIQTIAELDPDYVAISFPKDAADILYLKKLLKEVGSNASVIAKIERAEALKNIDEILSVSEGIMVARGDLNLEIGDAVLIAEQKRLIQAARRQHKIAITATEMMQSMIENVRPTRAEISDIANAVLDGTDSVMLSGETAIGKHPVTAVEIMSRICQGAEQGSDWQQGFIGVKEQKPERIDQAIAFAAIHVGRDLDVQAIAALTESGSSALWMSRIDSRIPIYALTPHLKTCRKVTLYRGVYPGFLQTEGKKPDQVNQEVVELLIRFNVIKEGDLIVLTKGDLLGMHGGTNAMKVIRAAKKLGKQSD